MPRQRPETALNGHLSGRQEHVALLLAGGAKPTQDRDIKTALKLARML